MFATCLFLLTPQERGYILSANILACRELQIGREVEGYIQGFSDQGVI